MAKNRTPFWKKAAEGMSRALGNGTGTLASFVARNAAKLGRRLGILPKQQRQRDTRPKEVREREQLQRRTAQIQAQREAARQRQSAIGQLGAFAEAFRAAFNAGTVSSGSIVDTLEAAGVPRMSAERAAEAQARQEQRNARITAMTETQFRIAARGDTSSILGDAGEDLLRIFYSATKEAWVGKDPSKRNEYIMEALGAQDLDEAYQIVMEQQQEAIEVANRRARRRKIGDTADMPGDEQSDYDEMMVLVKPLSRMAF